MSSGVLSTSCTFPTESAAKQKFRLTGSVPVCRRWGTQPTTTCRVRRDDSYATSGRAYLAGPPSVNGTGRLHSTTYIYTVSQGGNLTSALSVDWSRAKPILSSNNPEVYLVNMALRSSYKRTERADKQWLCPQASHHVFGSPKI